MPKTGENIYKRKDGRWEGRIRKTNPAGEKKYHSVYGKTYKELKEKMEKEKQKYSACGKECMLSVGEAAELWIADKKDSWKIGTYTMYRNVVDKYVIPGFDKMPVCLVDNHAVELFYNSLKKKNGSLSNSYMAYIIGVLQRVIRHTEKKSGNNMQVPYNPVAREKKKKIMPPDGIALAKLEEYLLGKIGNDTSLGVLIALHTGLRIGELCALTWKNIDLDSGVLHVQGSIQRVKDYDGKKNKTKLVVSTPKTSDSVRDIPLPRLLLDILKEQQKDGEKPVIAGVREKWMDPRTLQYRFKTILKECDIEYFNFHMLRHAFATRCIELGCDVKTLCELLGHSDIKVTLGIYVHSTMQMKKSLMGMVEAYSNHTNINLIDVKKVVSLSE